MSKPTKKQIASRAATPCSASCPICGKSLIENREWKRWWCGSCLYYGCALTPTAVNQPQRDNLTMIHNVPLQEGDWAVYYSNPGHFLRIHPSKFGKLANDPAYSFFRQNAYMHAPGIGEAVGLKVDRSCGLHAMPCSISVTGVPRRTYGRKVPETSPDVESKVGNRWGP